MILLDTCALVWWTLFPDQLSPAAALACAGIAQHGGMISSISIWEIGLKVRKEKLELGLSLWAYVAKLRKLQLNIIAVDEAIWIKNLELDWEHTDPADRTIVATAMLKEVPLVTVDKSMREFYPKVVW